MLAGLWPLTLILIKWKNKKKAKHSQINGTDRAVKLLLFCGLNGRREGTAKEGPLHRWPRQGSGGLPPAGESMPWPWSRPTGRSNGFLGNAQRLWPGWDATPHRGSREKRQSLMSLWSASPLPGHPVSTDHPHHIDSHTARFTHTARTTHVAQTTYTAKTTDTAQIPSCCTG